VNVTWYWENCLALYVVVVVFVVAVPIAGHGLCEGSLMTVSVRLV